MIKKLVLTLQALAFILPLGAHAEKATAQKWLQENRTDLKQEKQLNFVICEAGTK